MAEKQVFLWSRQICILMKGKFWWDIRGSNFCVCSAGLAHSRQFDPILEQPPIFQPRSAISQLMAGFVCVAKEDAETKRMQQLQLIQSLSHLFQLGQHLVVLQCLIYIASSF